MSYIKKILYLLTFTFISADIFSMSRPQTVSENQQEHQEEIPDEPQIPSELALFIKCYSEIDFTLAYDETFSDWRISFTSYDKQYNFLWQNSCMLPENEIQNPGKYWPLLYTYPLEMYDPKTFTEDQIAQMKNFGSSENRKSNEGTPMFFFDALYDSHTRGSLESHLTRTTFLGKKTTVHERIVPPLKRAEEKILELSKSDSETKAFIDGIKSADAYYWRIISGTNRKSFHSLGIALDVLPVKLNGKAIFWSWTKDINPEGWMLTPLNARWMPPQKVIEIMEDEGFIWGGKWIIFDNMHFEYHPELVQFARAKNNLDTKN